MNSIRRFLPERRIVLVCVAVLAAAVLALCALSGHYRIFMPYYADADVTRLVNAVDACACDHLAQLKEMRSMLRHALSDELRGYDETYYGYMQELGDVRSHMKEAMNWAVNIGMYMDSQDAVFRETGQKLDFHQAQMLARRAYERSHEYQSSLMLLYQIVWDEALRDSYLEEYVSLLLAVMEADEGVTISQYQLVIREAASWRQLQRGEYEDLRADEYMTQEQTGDLLYLSDNDLRALYVPHLHALWEAEQAFEAYRTLVEQQFAARESHEEGNE